MRSLLICCLLVTTLPVSAAGVDAIGDAYDIKSGELLYTEFHSTGTDADGAIMRTEYKDPAGALLGQRKVTYADGRVQSYRLQQPRVERTESMARQAQSIAAEIESYGKSKQKALRSENLDEVVIDAGFSNFIQRNWSTLLNGESAQLNFASIAQMDIVRLEIGKSKKQPQNDAGMIMFDMTPANRFFKLLVAPVRVGYYTQDRSLAYYRGISNIKDPSGENYKVEIKFRRDQEPESAAPENVVN